MALYFSLTMTSNTPKCVSQ